MPVEASGGVCSRAQLVVLDRQNSRNVAPIIWPGLLCDLNRIPSLYRNTNVLFEAEKDSEEGVSEESSRIVKPTDLLSVSDLMRPQLEGLLDLATQIKVELRGWDQIFPGRSLVCYFEEPFTQTTASFAAAAYRLGMLPIMLRADGLQFGRAESIADTARVISSYASAIVMRTSAQHTLEEAAEAASVPVINALSDDHCPCQALADLLTLRDRFGRLDDLKLAYVGNSDNVAHSLMEAGALTGMHVVIGCPPGRRPHPDIEATARRIAAVQGGSVAIVTDPRQAVVSADVIYTDGWGPAGEEAERDRHVRDFASYQVNAELMSLANPQVVFMHCLPAHRGQEVTAEVIDGPSSIVWEQAANRLPVEQALIYALVSGEWEPHFSNHFWGTRKRVSGPRRRTSANHGVV